jgi:hypothetical protein
MDGGAGRTYETPGSTVSLDETASACFSSPAREVHCSVRTGGGGAGRLGTSSPPEHMPPGHLLGSGDGSGTVAGSIAFVLISRSALS